jgi:phenylalanyl-tRNA synthetase beta chain
MESAVSMETENVIWESATFDAVSVRLSAQRHGVRTDASTRYEKSLDPLLASFATARIFDYLHFLDKSINVTAHGSYLDESQVKNITLEVSYEFINTKAGIRIPEEKVNAILTSLGFTYTIHNSQLTITVPSWRASKDVSIREDIAEEVIRIYGYDNIPLSPLTSEFSISSKNTEKSLRNSTLVFFQ